MVESVLAPVDRVLAEATERVAVEGKTSEPVIGPVAELALEISVVAIALAVEQVQAVRVREPQMASAIALSHPAPGSVRVATPLVALGLTEALLDQQVTAEVAAWEEVDSVVVAPEEAAHVLAVADVVGVADVEDDKTAEEENEIQLKYQQFFKTFLRRLCDHVVRLSRACPPSGSQAETRCGYRDSVTAEAVQLAERSSRKSR